MIYRVSIPGKAMISAEARLVKGGKLDPACPDHCARGK
jgi:hypothetical protein